MLKFSKISKARDYYWRKLNDPNKFKTKYARRKGFQYSTGVNWSNEHNDFYSGTSSLGGSVFPFNIGHDGADGPIRHRDFRSHYKDLNPETVINWYENPKSNQIVDRLEYKKDLNDSVYEKTFAKIGPRIPDWVFPFYIGDIVEVVAGKCRGDRGPVCYVDRERNYVVVAGCNIDRTINTKQPWLPPTFMERALLPKHLRLVHPKEKYLIKNLQFQVDDNEEIIRIDGDTKLPIPHVDMEGHGHSKMVEAGGLINSTTESYPIGNEDTEGNELKNVWKENEFMKKFADEKEKRKDVIEKNKKKIDPEDGLKSFNQELRDYYNIKKDEDERETWYY